MSPSENTVTRLVAWGESDANVRRLVLVGSRAADPVPDELADFDLQVYANEIGPYTRDDAWLAGIGPVWVWVPDEYRDAEIRVPTLLAIFDGGVKVDFAFYPAHAVSYGIRHGLAHRVLVDKTGNEGGEPAAIVPPLPPLAGRSGLTQDEFSRAVREFWFEAYHVGKYLSRGELWLAKSRDWAAKKELLRIVDWSARTPADDDPFPDPGKSLRQRVRGETWDELHEIFGGFGRADGWRTLFATIDLFRKLSREIASERGFAYLEAMDRNLSGFIADLRSAELDGAP